MGLWLNSATTDHSCTRAAFVLQAVSAFLFPIRFVRPMNGPDGEISFFLRLGSVPDQGEYQIASGGAALPNGWELLSGEAIRADCAPGENESQHKYGTLSTDIRNGPLLTTLEMSPFARHTPGGGAGTGPAPGSTAETTISQGAKTLMSPALRRIGRGGAVYIHVQALGETDSRRIAASVGMVVRRASRRDIIPFGRLGELPDLRRVHAAVGRRRRRRGEGASRRRGASVVGHPVLDLS
jgi:hypothetical protein